MKELTHPDTHEGVYSKTVFGFWLYLLTDFMMFATFFATYAVLVGGVADGPGPKHLFNLRSALIQTLSLLICGFTSGLAGAFAHRQNKKGVFVFFILTFIGGAFFLQREFTDFTTMIIAGNSWARSGFLSAYFTLTGMHALHVVFGLLWTLVLLTLVWSVGLNEDQIRRLTCLRMFWQFLNIVWIFIFSLVYLIGVV